MSAYLTAMTGGGTCLALGVVAIARTWPGPRGRHRATGRTVPLEELLGPPAPYTTPDYADVPMRGVLAQGWRPCSGPCEQEMPSVLHADGSWQCGHCLAISGGDPRVPETPSNG